MGRLGLAAALLALALAVAAPGAAAAPPWTEQQEADAGCECFLWRLAYGSSGNALAVGRAQNEFFRPRLGVRAPGGTWSFRQGPRVGDAQVGVSGDRVLLLGAVGDPTRDPRIVLASGRADGTFGDPRRLGPGTRPALAVHPAGTAIAAWVRRDGKVVAMHRRPDGELKTRFKAPVVLGESRLRSWPVAVAANARGDAVVMFRRNNRRAVLRTLDRKGRPLRSFDLGRTGGTDQYSVALADDGRFTAAWHTLRMFARGGTTPPSVRLFSGSIHLEQFAGRELDTYSEDPFAGLHAVEVELDSSGRPIVAWTGNVSQPGDDRRVVRAVTGDALGSFGDPATVIELPDRSAVLTGLVTGTLGRALIVGATSQGSTPLQVVASFRPTWEAAFGPTEEVGDAAGPAAPVAAFDPAGTTPLAIWGALRSSERADPR